MSEPERFILVVEDEPIIRMCAAEFVEDTGFTPIEVGDAVAALAKLESQDGIAVVFTDINLPNGMDGLTLAAEVERRWPQIRILIASGRTAPPSSQLSGKVSFIPKPYGFGEFEAALDSLLTEG
jgi:CheY-like chemotaxis protein